MTGLFHAIRVRVAIGVWVSIALAAVVGCAQIPTSGPVHTGVPIPDAGKVGSQITGPIGGDVPRGIVQGFLTAQRSGLDDDFAVARQYLTARAAETWNPLARVMVTPALTNLKPQDQDDGALSVVVPAVASIDSDGRYGQVPAPTEMHLTFEMEQTEDGEWRISRLDDGIVMTEPTVRAVFRSTSLYFISLDDVSLVPEERWFPAKNQASSAITALLAGPSNWLRDAVRTTIPAATTLELGSVRPVDAAGNISVELSGDLLSAPPADYPFIRAQIESTLIDQIPDVKTVRVKVSGGSFEPELPSPALIRNPEVGTTAIAVAAGQLVTINGKTVRPVAGVAPIPDLPVRAVASDYDRQRFYVVAADSLFELPTDGSPPNRVLDGAQLTSPSVDRYGCVWSTPRSSTGAILVACPGGAFTVRAESMKGREILDLQVSRDGARVALVIDDAGESGGAGLEIAGVVRDGAGVPLSMGPSVAFGAGVTEVEQVRWLDEVQVAVLARQGNDELQAAIVATSGPTQALTKADSVAELAAGKGERSIWLRTTDGHLLTGAGELWTRVAEGISVVAMPG